MHREIENYINLFKKEVEKMSIKKMLSGLAILAKYDDDEDAKIKFENDRLSIEFWDDSRPLWHEDVVKMIDLGWHQGDRKMSCNEYDFNKSWFYN